MNDLKRTCAELPALGGSADRFFARATGFSKACGWALAGAVLFAAAWAQKTPAKQAAATAQPDRPPRAVAAERFLAQRGILGRRTGGASRIRSRVLSHQAQSPASGTQSPGFAGQWEPLGPMQVITGSFGAVTGRISSLALDPSDAAGNRLLVGTTGGGVWMSQNAGTANAATVVFTPLTDRPSALAGQPDSSISIGAVTMQPGETGVILAGTGDTNDALDSYYGGGILRSADGGNTWTLIQNTSDLAAGLGTADHGFIGEGFAGFAWSTVDQNTVVAAVSQAYEGELVDAGLAGYSYTGLYYSTDSGATWHLALVTDGNGQNVQGPLLGNSGVDGNAATAVVWNPVRKLFVAAVRFHGYYQSPDGVTWTRLAQQPGAGLTAAMCPTNIGAIGSEACPIFRGALAVNPVTGDTFAWTVDINNQDQGLWQDVCGLSGSACSNPTIAFTTQWSTTLLETETYQGAATIRNGDYNLVLAAVPSGQDTLLLAGANDLWKCSLAMGCPWRNTTNSTTSMSAQVGEYQHALAWNPANPLEIFDGTDSGLWRSEDAIGETGPAGSASDATHWQNLNGGLGSLAEVESLAGEGATSYTLMAGLGANGTAGVKGDSLPPAQWPQILSGEGGPVAIDPTNLNNWYANNEAGVSIHLCTDQGDCTPADFGAQAAVTDADAGDDGLTMTVPAAFLVDPADSTQLLIATCRLWRGPASGSGWTAANAVLPMLGGGADCGSSPQIRSLAAASLVGGGETVYVGTYGLLNGGGNMGGHVLSATMDANGNWSGWNDLTWNPVTNDTDTGQFNAYQLDVSSLTIDPHDTSGQTLYATIAGIPYGNLDIRNAYRSIDGGAHWTHIMSNLTQMPANALLVDPVDANTVYLGTDVGVWATQQVSTCGNHGVSCWTAFGTGLPEAPVTSLFATQPAGSPNVLVAGTYGRGIWQIPLLTAGQQMTTATPSPNPLAFAAQAQGTTSAAQTVTITNTGGIALAITSIVASGDFSETDDCVGAQVNFGQGCSVQVTFSPTALGPRSGQLTIEGNIQTGNIVVNLSGTGAVPPDVTLTPTSIDFGSVEAGTTSTPLSVTASNAGGVDSAIASLTVTPPFTLAGNACGASIPAGSDCQFTVTFSPQSAGAASGTLTLVGDAGTHTVKLSGTGTAAPTDTLAPGSLTFSATIVGVQSAAQSVTLTNSGANPLTSITISTSGPFQQTNNCTTQLAGPASCTIGVVFLPTATGSQSGSLTVSDILRSQTIQLQGSGVNPPAFSVSPPSLVFSGTQMDATSASQMITVTNSGGAPMANVGFQISGLGASSFAVGSTTCGGELDAGASCTAQITFTPSAAGALAATLAVSTSTRGANNAAIEFMVSLSGNGTLAPSAALQAQPAQVSFPTTGVGQTSGPVAVALTNMSTKVSLDKLNIAASAPFQVSSTSCGASLAPGASCTVNVEFAPATAGPLTGSLVIGASVLSQPATVPLSGSGFDFTAAAGGSPSQTVSSGETAAYSLSLTPAAGASGSFTFACNSLPEYASCSFSPTTLAVAENATGTVNVAIATSQTEAAMERPGGLPGAVPLSLAGGILVLFWRARRRAGAWMSLILLAAAVAFGVGGCSGSGGGGGGGHTQQTYDTPAGSYTVNVVASSGGVQHTVALTLIVD